jgi:hypothetical protein
MIESLRSVIKKFWEEVKCVLPSIRGGIDASAGEVSVCSGLMKAEMAIT